MGRDHQFEIVHASIAWLANNRAQKPDLNALAAKTGYSPAHIQRVFLEWAGLSPKQFLQAMTREAAIKRLVGGASSLEASLAVGLSSPGRLHDLLITTDALTPGEIKSNGKGVQMQYGYSQSPFGLTLVAWNPRGISFLGFCHEVGAEQSAQELRRQWPDAELTESPGEAEKLIQQVFSDAASQPIRVWLRGSPFQLKIWQALMAIPEGSHATYGQIAEFVGQENAARAIGNAVGSNPLAWIIPCHRVIQKIGDIGGYRWGSHLKGAMIGKELGHIV